MEVYGNKVSDSVVNGKVIAEVVLVTILVAVVLLVLAPTELGADLSTGMVGVEAVGGVGAVVIEIDDGVLTEDGRAREADVMVVV